MIYFIVFIFGAVIGSFLNVCIYRIPRNESIVFPGSHCTKCNKKIQWYDNIPFFSYIVLGGKCRACKEKISFRYFLVEAISAVVFTVLYMFFGFTYQFWVYSLISFGLITATFIDFDFQIIPDRISLGGTALGVLLSVVIPKLHETTSSKEALISSLIGLIVGGGIIYLTGVFGKIVFRKDAMGGGDVKLMAMFGAFLGWQNAVLIYFLAPFFGIIPALYVKFVKKDEVIPYGPFLSLGAFTVMLWGEKILGMLFYQ